MVDQEPTKSGKVIFVVPVLELCMHMSVHVLISCHASADGDDAKAEIVQKAMRQAKLRAEVIAEFTISDLLELHRLGYRNAPCIEATQRLDLEKSKLEPALIGVFLMAIEGI